MGVYSRVFRRLICILTFWIFLAISRHEGIRLCHRAEADSSIFQTIPTGMGALVISWSKTPSDYGYSHIAIKNPRDYRYYSSKPTETNGFGLLAPGIIWHHLAWCIFQRFGSVSQVPWNANAHDGVLWGEVAQPWWFPRSSKPAAGGAFPWMRLGGNTAFMASHGPHNPATISNPWLSSKKTYY